MDERMLLSGPAECLFLAINFSLRIALLSVSGKRLAVFRLALTTKPVQNQIKGNVSFQILMFQLK